MKTFGLIGKSLAHSFSKKHFSEKFEAKGLVDCQYLNFELSSIEEFPDLIHQRPDIKGLNVTIPYKKAIIPYLDEMDETSKKVGAVNTISFKNGKLRGFNTDVYGFEKSLFPFLKAYHTKALILGTGGASDAVAFVLKKLNIPFLKVSRNPKNEAIDYNEANSLLPNYPILINTTPVGTFPNLGEMPPINTDYLTENHLVYDLIYNPVKTKLLDLAQQKGALVCNGKEMLLLQAEKSWVVWNEF